MPKVLGRSSIALLKAMAKGLAIPLRQIGMPIGLVPVQVRLLAILEVGPSRLHAIVESMASNLVKLRRWHVPMVLPDARPSSSSVRHSHHG